MNTTMNNDYQDPFSDTDIAVVCGPLVTDGGAERITIKIAEMFDAPIYTPRYDPQKMSKEFHEKAEERVRLLKTDEQEEMDFANNPIKSRREYDTVDVLDGFRALDTSPVQRNSENDRLLIATDTEGALISYITGLPYITYVHHTGRLYTDYFWTAVKKQDSLFGKLKHIGNSYRMRRDMKEAIRMSETVISNSHRTTSLIAKNLDIPKEDVELVYPYVDMDVFNTDVEQESVLDLDRYFFAPQRLEVYKNIHVLIEAAKLAQEHLVISGYGSIEDFVRRESMYSDYIHSVGYVHSEDLARLYRNAEAAMQGTIREDFGMVPPESFACGTPCIVPSSGGFHETVGDGWNGEDARPSYKTPRGVLLGEDDFNAENVAGILQNFDKDDYDEDELVESARKFDLPTFEQRMNEIVYDN